MNMRYELLNNKSNDDYKCVCEYVYTCPLQFLEGKIYWRNYIEITMMHSIHKNIFNKKKLVNVL